MRLIVCPYCGLEFGLECARPDCFEKHYARGWCYRHYREWWDEHSSAPTARKPAA